MNIGNLAMSLFIYVGKQILNAIYIVGSNGSPVIKTNLYPIFYMFSAIGYGITLIPGIPAAILTIQSHRNLDNIVESYNANANDVSLNFGTTSNGVGLVLKF